MSQEVCIGTRSRPCSGHPLVQYSPHAYGQALQRESSPTVVSVLQLISRSNHHMVRRRAHFRVLRSVSTDCQAVRLAAQWRCRISVLVVRTPPHWPWQGSLIITSAGPSRSAAIEYAYRCLGLEPDFDHLGFEHFRAHLCRAQVIGIARRYPHRLVCACRCCGRRGSLRG